jgi:amino acid adenylation domain-containing protein
VTLSYGHPVLVHHILDRAAARSPEACAVATASDEISYQRLRELSHAAAEWLLKHGIGHGDRVLVQAWNSATLPALLFGASRIGAVLVPLNPEMRPYQVRQVHDDADPGLVLADAASVAGLRAAGIDGVHQLEELWEHLGRSVVDDVAREVDPADLALLIYTSGSTSTPKGVMSPHRQITFVTDAINQRLVYRPTDRIFLRLPMSFDYGLYQVMLAAHSGATLYVADQQSNVGVLRELAASRATVVPLVPSLATMLNQLAVRRAAPRGVRLFTNTGAVLPPNAIADLRRNFPGSAIVLMYGITECKRVSIGDPDADLHDARSLGPPLPGTEVSIVDDAGQRVGPGVTGQIVVRGPHVMAGYWRAEELSRQRFGPDSAMPVLYTGDYGSLNDRGHIYFEGRRDDIVKRRGTRVSTLEVEAAVLDVPAVRSAAVSVGPAGELVLFVSGDVDAATLTHELADRLEAAKRPDRIVRIDTMPLGHNGKIDRSQLRMHAQSAQ